MMWCDGLLFMCLSFKLGLGFDTNFTFFLDYSGYISGTVHAQFSQGKKAPNEFCKIYTSQLLHYYINQG